ncbi:MAG: S9 family peptidase, partial [Phycisphaerae bacterium]|nr:S9 family peptidase [Phycisphaerae bacterium]
MFRITRIGVLACVLMWAIGCEPSRPLKQTGPGPQATAEKPPAESSLPKAPPVSGTAYDAVPLIPRRVLFGNPDRLRPQLSPDGSKLGFVAPVDNVLNVWVGPSDDPSSARPVTKDTHRGIRSFFFAHTNQHLVYIQDKDGDENWRVYSVDLGTNETRELTPGTGVRAQVQQLSPQFPDEILIGLNNRDPQFHDLYRVNIGTGQRTLVQENEQFAAFVTDEEFQVRFGLRITPDGGNELLRRTGDAWGPFLVIGPDDTITTHPVGFDESGRTLFMIDSRDRNTAALTAVDAETAETTLLFQDDRADVDRILQHPTRKTLQAVGVNHLRPSWTFANLRVQADFQLLQRLADGDVNVISRSLDDGQWIVAIEVDNGPVRYYHFDRTQRKSRFLFTNNAALEDATLARMHPVVIPARDGLELVSYLSLPVGTDEDEDGRPAEPLPLVLYVHGGPWARDLWEYDAYHQWLANRGYAVLSVNYRGSTGFGKDFINAGDREWAGKMHDDLIDAVRWAVEAGVADPQRVAIMGGSYGG